MFEKKKLLAVLHRKGRQKLRVKPAKLTQREIIADIEKLGQGEVLSYRLSETYGGQLAVVEFNTMYPWKGRKYILSTQTLINGKPVGEKTLVMESDEAKDIAAWVSHHRGLLHPTGQTVFDEEALTLKKEKASKQPAKSK
ncbi:hypothetical protein ACFLXX_05700 [Chloroflexota bacterium]